MSPQQKQLLSFPPPPLGTTVVNNHVLFRTEGTRRVISVNKAERGLYTFVLENDSGETLSPDIVFHIFEGKPGERIRKIKNVELSPHAVLKFKFILPDAVFWDDESYFTGTIENSDTTTKFNDKTGLIWKEEKDY